MPAPESPDARRGQLLHGMFWSGVGLAPLAILILLFGQSTTSLRIAVVLAVLTIVLLAVSVALRPSVELVRLDIEERVLDEVEQVRLRTRHDVTTAARNTHRALSEKIHVLTESVEALRNQLEDLQTRPMLPESPGISTGAAPVAPGVVHRTETVHVTRRTTTVDPTHEGRGTVYGSRAAMDGEWRERQGSGEESDWEATYRSLRGKSSATALPAAAGEPPSRYVDYEDREPVRSRGRERERRYREGGHRYDDRRDDRYDRRDQGYDRETDDRDAYDRERGYDRERDYDRDRGYDRDRAYDRDRGYDRDRAYDRERGSDHERDRDRGRGRDYERDRYERDRYERGHDRDYHEREPDHRRERPHDESPGWDDRGHAPPRPRSPLPPEQGR